MLSPIDETDNPPAANRPMNRETADHWLQRATVVVLLAQLVLGVAMTGMVRTQDFLIAQGLTVGLILLWLARLWLNKSIELLWPPVCWAAAAFTIYAIVLTARADVSYAAKIELQRILVYFTVFVSALNGFRTRGAVRALAVTVIAIATVSALYAGYQAFVNPDYVWHFKRPETYGYGRRGSGFFINPNNLATLLSMSLPLGLAFALVSRIKSLPKIFLGYTSLVIVAGIAVTLSRGGWIATAVSMTLFFTVLFRMRERRSMAVVALAVIAGIGILAISQSEMGKLRIKRALDPKAHPDVRHDIWRTGMDMWRDNAWTGTGPGHFDLRYKQYRALALQDRPKHVHNDYLNTLTDYGAVGFVLAAAACFALLHGVMQTWRGLRKSFGDDLGCHSDSLAFTMGAGCGFTALAIHAFFDFPVQIPGLAMFAAVIAGILASLGRRFTGKDRFSLGVAGKAAFSAIALAAGFFLTAHGLSLAKESRHLSLADAEVESFQEKIAQLEIAQGIEPGNPETPFVLGELHRLRSFQLEQDYAEQAEIAIEWFEAALRINPYDALAQTRLGMCLDWLDRPDEAWKHYELALELDPNGFHPPSIIGWHYLQLNDLRAAKPWFEMSFSRRTYNNDLSWQSLKLIEEQLETSR